MDIGYIEIVSIIISVYAVAVRIALHTETKKDDKILLEIKWIIDLLKKIPGVKKII